MEATDGCIVRSVESAPSVWKFVTNTDQNEEKLYGIGK